MVFWSNRHHVGAGVSCTTEERNRLVTLSVEVAKGRVPIVARHRFAGDLGNAHSHRTCGQGWVPMRC